MRQKFGRKGQMRQKLGRKGQMSQKTKSWEQKSCCGENEKTSESKVEKKRLTKNRRVDNEVNEGGWDIYIRVTRLTWGTELK